LVEATELTQWLDQRQNISANERLATGEAYLAHTQFNKGTGYLENFFQCENVLLGHERHIFGHTVDTAKIAAIRDRQTHIINTALKAVDEYIGQCMYNIGECSG
jgi:hypothetical protein